MQQVLLVQQVPPALLVQVGPQVHQVPVEQVVLPVQRVLRVQPVQPELLQRSQWEQCLEQQQVEQHRLLIPAPLLQESSPLLSLLV